MSSAGTASAAQGRVQASARGRLMPECDSLSCRIELERKDAERALLERVIAIFKADSVNGTYRQAYKRALKKISKLIDVNTQEQMTRFGKSFQLPRNSDAGLWPPLGKPVARYSPKTGFARWFLLSKVDED